MGSLLLCVTITNSSIIVTASKAIIKGVNITVISMVYAKHGGRDIDRFTDYIARKPSRVLLFSLCHIDYFGRHPCTLAP